MTTKKSNSRTAVATPQPAKRNPNVFEVTASKDTESQKMAKLVTMSVGSAITLKSYSGAGDGLELPDLAVEMEKAGDEAVAGDLSRVERMLANQAMTLDAIFNNMAQRSFRQESFKGIEVMMRLALKAQAQARSTAEALALLKNPMPYIKQANLTTGPQQVNNAYAGTPLHNGTGSSAGNSQSEPNKLLEVDDGQRLDYRAEEASGRVDQALETVGAVHRTQNTRGKKEGGQ